MQIQELQLKAEKLAILRQGITEIENIAKEQTEHLKAQRDALQEELLADMARENVASLRVTGGDMYTRATRRGISIVNEVAARKWALENNAFSIDRIQVAQKLKDATELPTGFEKVTTDYISIRKSTAK